MSAVESSTPPRFYQRHQEAVGHGVLLTGVAIAAITLGVIVAMSCSSNLGDAPFVIGFAGGIAGGFLATVMISLGKFILKNVEINKKRALRLTLFVVTFLALGMVLGVTMLFNGALPKFKAILDYQKSAFPDLNWENQTQALKTTTESLRGIITFGSMVAVIGCSTLLGMKTWEWIKHQEGKVR